MIEQLLAITRNTFLEAIRQPVMLVVLIAATVMLVLSNPLATFTMDDDQKMFIDIGLATVFLCGMLLAAFIATSVLTREIENKTALTVVSKPVPRPIFIIGKFIGVAGAMLIAIILMSCVFMLVEMHTVLQTVRDPYHLPVLLFSTIAILGALGIGVWCNFFYGRPFPSTVVMSGAVLFVLAYIFALMFTSDFSWQHPSDSFRAELWQALAGIAMAIMVLTAIAIAASTRFGQVMTLCIIIGVFMLGLLSDALFGRHINDMQSTWRERAAGVSDERLADMDLDINIPRLRQWMRDQLTEEAQGKRELALLQVDRAVAGLEEDLRGSLDTAAAQAQITETRRRGEDQAQQTFDQELLAIERRINEIETPITRDELIADVELVRIIELTSGEWDATFIRQRSAYPPLHDAVVRPGEQFTYALYRTAHSIVPNFQLFLLTDAVTQDHRIPANYIARAAVYDAALILAALGLAVILFQRKEVG